MECIDGLAVEFEFDPHLAQAWFVDRDGLLDAGADALAIMHAGETQASKVGKAETEPVRIFVFEA